MGVEASPGGASICAVVTVIVTLLQNFDNTPDDLAPASDPKPLGRAPYRTYSCTPTKETVDNLSLISAELKKSVGQLEVEVDWDQYDEFTQNASDCAAKNSFAEAVHLHCKSISHLVATLKSDRDSLRASDSHIDLI